MWEFDEVSVMPAKRTSMLGDYKDRWSSEQGLILSYLEQLVHMVADERTTMVSLPLYVELVQTFCE